MNLTFFVELHTYTRFFPTPEDLAWRHKHLQVLKVTVNLTTGLRRDREGHHDAICGVGGGETRIQGLGLLFLYIVSLDLLDESKHWGADVLCSCS